MVPALTSEVAAGENYDKLNWGDWAVCYDQAWIEDVKGRGRIVPRADNSHQMLIRYRN